MINTDLENASKIMIGSLEVKAIYVGSNLIWNSVPYDAEIEYLESTDTQYIDTEMYNDNSIVVDMKMSAVGKDRLNGSEYNPNNNPNNRFKWGSNGNGYPYYGYLNNHTLDGVSFTHNDPYTFHLELSNQHVENSSGTTVLSSQDQISIFSSETIKLFRCYSNGTFVNINGTGSMRIYYCNITNSVRSMLLIPVRVGQVGYMYDKVSGQLFGNSGSGSFILGPDKVPSTEHNYTKLEYIESTADGGQYIDLNVKLYEILNTNYDIAIKFNILGQGKNNTTNAPIFACLDPVNPWPGTFIRKTANASSIVGRYIGADIKDNTLGSINQIIELPVKTPPEKNVYNYNNSGRTHLYGTSLFCVFSDTSNNPKDFTHARLYYFKLFVEGVLIRDMIPCKSNITNAIGLYDRVNNAFYTSPNEAAFVAGPEILS